MMKRIGTTILYLFLVGPLVLIFSGIIGAFEIIKR